MPRKSFTRANWLCLLGVACFLTRVLAFAAEENKPGRVPPPKAGPARTVLAPINLALSKPAIASASQPGHDPAHAVDGDPDTRWCAPDNGNGYWWQVDLRKPEDITGCRISWEQDGQPYQYRIEGSEDTQSWKTLVDETRGGPRPQLDEHKFAASGIRHVRITVTSAPAGAWASFWEFEVFGKKLVEKIAGQAGDPRLRDVKVPPGFEATIFAAPPDISYPTCISAVPTGEVFVGVDQNGSLDARPGRGWVVRCLDTDHDGVADKFNIFARMDSPRGIVFDHNTLYVMHPPVVEAYYDDNGDGVADRSEVLVRGLAHDLKFRGADHTCNGVRMGIDGWLYIALGDYGAFKAVGKDGSSLQVHGGGIVRVRPDGTGLELVVQGTRNIYDVAMDPLMNIFTCDNTNDGDDWNVRLSHMIPTARYGYPSLFKHFSDEMIQTMADYGGGSPTGALFIDEPGFPAGFGHGLYTCQWGWNNVTRHPLEPGGATFKTPQAKDSFISIPRPTGIDEDGEGHLYVASWKGATFTYAGPNVGYVIRVTPENHQAVPFPDLSNAPDERLLDYLASPSAVWRLHVQREFLRRGKKPVFARGLERLALSKQSLPVRVAAIFTLHQLLGAAAQEPLLRVAKTDDLREFALRALSDRTGEAAGVPSRVFTDALSDRDPRVQSQAIIALNRLERRDTADVILPLAASSDPAVAHLAFRALVSLHAVEPCLKAIDQPDAALLPGAFRALRNMHDPRVVDGLIERLNHAEMQPSRRLMLEALCRLYYREADWDGSWWGTRPDTSGPYFKAVTWDQSEKIGQTLRGIVANADESTLRFLLPELQRHKIDSPGLTSLLINIAARMTSLRSAVVDLFTGRPSIPAEAIPFLENTVLSTDQDSALRTRAFEGLGRSDQPGALTAAVRILTSTERAGNAGDLFASLRNDFIHDPRRARNIAFFEKLTSAPEAPLRELAFAVLLQIAGNPKTQGRSKNIAERTIDNAWKSANATSLMRAIGDAHAIAYAERVRARLNDPDQKIAAAAEYASSRLGSNVPSSPELNRKNLIGNLAYEQVVQEATENPGDPKIGARLFDTVGCIKCHTTSKSEPLKGPFLGDIAARYNRKEILDSILRPNAQIAQGFATTWVETKDGTEYEGFVVREAGDEIEIRNLLGAAVIAKKDIADRGTRTTSTMPEGLVAALTPQELASLLAYLESLKPR